MHLSCLLAASSLAFTACRSGESAGPTPAPSSKTTAVEPTAPATTPPTTSEGQPAAPATASARSWNFDSDRADAPPTGFSFGRTGGGPPGKWVIRADPTAPSAPSILAQLDADATDVRFPLATADAPPVADLRLSVKCKLISGKVDQACGLVFRYRDENNYYITRANALEGNVRLYYLKDGKRRQLASWSGRVTRDAWHDYAVEARGDHLQVYWDGKPVLDHHDSTFSAPGRVGVWTKADSITHFDDLTVAPLGEQ